MARKRKKGHARKRRGHSLKKRYGRSEAGHGAMHMNVTGQLVLNPHQLEAVIEKAVEAAVEESVPEAVEASVEETVPEAVEESVEHWGGMDY